MKNHIVAIFRRLILWAGGCWLLMLPSTHLAAQQMKLGDNITRYDSSAALEIESQRQTLLLPRIKDTAKMVKMQKDGALIYFENQPGAGANKGLYLRTSNKWNWIVPSDVLWAAKGNSGITNSHFLGTTDIHPLVFKTNNVTRLFIDSTTGYTGFGTSTPAATLHNQGTTLLGANNGSILFSTNGPLGMAKNTVDSFTVLTLNPSSADQYAEIPAPSNPLPGRVMVLLNNGSTVVHSGNFRIYDNFAGMFTWNGFKWASVGDGMGGNNFPAPAKLNFNYFSLLASSPGPPTTPGFSIGYNAMRNATGSGSHNAAIGTRAGLNIGAWYGNFAIGHDAMTGPINSSHNIAIGDSALAVSSGDSCIALGTRSLASNTTGSCNVSVGTDALRSVTTGSYNTAVGYQALANAGGNSSYNSAMGYRAAYGLTSGSFNTAVGAYALAGVVTGSYNTALGYCAGYTDSVNNSATNITNATAIGAFAQIQYSNTIILGSANPAYASNVGIGIYNPLQKLHVNGNINIMSYDQSSDGRLKKNIQPITAALGSINALQPVSFSWNQKATRNNHIHADKRTHYGFIAQELEKVLPEVVSTANDSMHSKAVGYGDIVPVLAEAVKERQLMIERMAKENEALEQRLLALEELKKQAEKILATKNNR